MSAAFRISRMAALAFMAVLAGCASAPATHVEADPQADLRAYKTFGFFEPAGIGERGYPALTGDLLRQATREQMQRLGYIYAERNPDLRVNILLKVEEREEIHSVPASVGRFAYRGWVTYAVEVLDYREGTLTIDLVDAKRNAMVWRGVAGDRISRSDKDAGDAIDVAVRDLFSLFPRPAAA